MYASDVGATFRLERTLRKHLQPFQIVGREILLRPNGRQGRNRIEACNIGHAGAGFVVIAADEERAQLTGAGNHLIGIGAVTDDVAQIPDYVVCGKSIDARLERINIRMNVTDNEDAHR